MARKMQRGNLRIGFLPAVTNTSAPTEAEITAGTDITDDVASFEGWSLTSSTIDANDMGSTQDKKAPGPDQTPDSSLIVHEDTVTNATRTLLAKGTVGFIYFTALGQTTDPEEGDKIDLFPIQVSGNNRVYNAGNETSKFRIDFSISGVIKTDVAVAA